MHKRAAFSVVELLIVMAIIADLAIIAIPAYARARRNAQNAALTNDIRILAASFEMHAAEFSRYPAETGPGVEPAGMGPYLKGVRFTDQTPIGGAWDWDYLQGYAVAALCVDLADDADPIQMVEIDTRIDNGILSTGIFRERSTRRYAYIIE